MFTIIPDLDSGKNCLYKSELCDYMKKRWTLCSTKKFSFRYKVLHWFLSRSHETHTHTVPQSSQRIPLCFAACDENSSFILLRQHTRLPTCKNKACTSSLNWTAVCSHYFERNYHSPRAPFIRCFQSCGSFVPYFSCSLHFTFAYGCCYAWSLSPVHSEMLFSEWLLFKFSWHHMPSSGCLSRHL